MNDETPSSNPIQITLPNIHRLLGLGWGVLALLLAVTFLLPNFSMATLQLNGIDVIRMTFKDTDSLRKIFDDSSFFLMVGVPIMYLLLAMVLGFAAVMRIMGKMSWLPMPVTITAIVTTVITVIGIFVIGDDARDVPFLGKLMPKPIWGYHAALIWQGFAATLGILHLMMNRRTSAQA
ncbi:MAG: hypothetical protein U0176_08295 [Bacteroidia bacterium]